MKKPAPQILRAAIRRRIGRRGLSITEAAALSRIPRARLTGMLNGWADLTPAQYRRLFDALGCGDAVTAYAVRAIDEA